MKISELIKDLKNIQREKGDIEIHSSNIVIGADKNLIILASKSIPVRTGKKWFEAEYSKDLFQKIGNIKKPNPNRLIALSPEAHDKYKNNNN